MNVVFAGQSALQSNCENDRNFDVLYFRNLPTILFILKKGIRIVLRLIKSLLMTDSIYFVLFYFSFLRTMRSQGKV